MWVVQTDGTEKNLNIPKRILFFMHHLDLLKSSLLVSWQSQNQVPKKISTIQLSAPTVVVHTYLCVYVCACMWAPRTLSSVNVCTFSRCYVWAFPLHWPRMSLLEEVPRVEVRLGNKVSGYTYPHHTYNLMAFVKEPTQNSFLEPY